MKSFIIILLFLTIMSGCADKNAFDKFNMSLDQELSIDNLQSSKIKTTKNIDGIVRVVYLNNIYPDTYNLDEKFYVSIYLKKDTEFKEPSSLTMKVYDKIPAEEIAICQKENLELSFFKDKKIIIKLNNKSPIKIEELKQKNKFSHLASTNNDWQRYYLITFKKEIKDKLSLFIINGASSSNLLKYKKNKH